MSINIVHLNDGHWEVRERTIFPHALFGEEPGHLIAIDMNRERAITKALKYLEERIAELEEYLE